MLGVIWICWQTDAGPEMHFAKSRTPEPTRPEQGHVPCLLHDLSLAQSTPGYPVEAARRIVLIFTFVVGLVARSDE